MRYTKENKELAELQLKRCSKCEVVKSFSFFPNCKQSKSGYYSMCRACKNLSHVKWAKANPDKVKYNEENRNQRRRSNVAKTMHDRIRRRATRSGIPFTIEEDDIIIPEYCPVLGIKLQVNTGRQSSENSPSLDKIIPELGYIKGNIQVISRKANSMKYNASIEELELFAKWILQSITQWKEIIK